MRVIITGGSGLIGRALAESLLSAGSEVIVLSRNPAGVAGFPPRVQVEKWDGRTAQGWAELVEDAAIVNLAGENIGAGRWSAERKRRILESRVNAGKAIVQAVEAVKHKPRVVIQASGVGYYGAGCDEEATEYSPPGSDFLAQVCVAWEASTAPVEALGVRRAIIRSASVLTPKGGVLPRMLLPFRFYVGGRISHGRQWFPWIHIADEVAAIRYLVMKGTTRGVFNLASPRPLTNAQFSRLLGEAMHRPAAVPIPAFALRLAFGEMASLLLEGKRATPQRLLQEGFVFRFHDPEVALQDLLRR